MWKRKPVMLNCVERSYQMDKLRIYSTDIFIILVAGVAIAFRAQTAGTPEPFDAYPKLITGVLIVLSIACLIQTRFYKTTDKKNTTISNVLNAVVLIGGIAIYILAISNIGYFVSSTLYLLIMFHLKRYGNVNEFLETKPIIADSLVSIAIVTSIAIVFKLALNLVFPESWLF